MNNEILTSYDDLVQPDFTQYCFDNVMGWITSVKHSGQINAAHNAVKLFRKKYPQEKARSQNLYRQYWKLKRELNQF